MPDTNYYLIDLPEQVIGQQAYIVIDILIFVLDAHGIIGGQYAHDPSEHRIIIGQMEEFVIRDIHAKPNLAQHE